MARDTLWIMAVHMLTAYDIVDPVDEKGNSVTADSNLEFKNAMVRFVAFLDLVSSKLMDNQVLHRTSR
jgi:hypothetical protein